MSRVRGAALLLVLWILVLLIGLIAVFAVTARTEGLQGRFALKQAQARYLAEAGVEIAVLHMGASDPARVWHPDGRPNRFDFEGAHIEVRVVDESGKIDINAVAPDLFAALVREVGGDPEKAPAIAGAMQDFRDADDLLSAGGGAEDGEYAAAGLPYGAKDRAFDTISELQQVLGIDGVLYRKLAPHITVNTGLARPNPEYASEEVLRALGLPPIEVEGRVSQREPRGEGAPPGPLAAPGTGTYSISSRATRPDGTQVEVNATVRLGAGAGFGQLYTPLAWRVGDPD
jgi:general secretion pathway protein K